MKKAGAAMKGVDVDQVVAIGSSIARLIPTHRQCSITISNYTNYTLTEPNMYVSSGSCTRALPHRIGASSEYMVEFKKTPHTARGAVGCFTYELQNPRNKSVTKQMAYLFSVPYDYNLYSNWHAGGFYSRGKSCDYDLWYEMYNNSEYGFKRRKGGQSFSYSDGEFKIEATMTDTYTPVMTVEIYNA